MFIEGLPKADREAAIRFNPKDWEGEYIKVTRSFNPRLNKEDRISYYKLSKYINPAYFNVYMYKGFAIENNFGGVVLCNFNFSLACDNYCQDEMMPISREDFIEGCKSLLTDDLKEVINWDKI